MMQHDVYDFEQVNGLHVSVEPSMTNDPGLSSTTRLVVWVLIMFVMLEAMCSFAGHVEESYLWKDKAPQLRNRVHSSPELSMPVEATMTADADVLPLSDTTLFSQSDVNTTASLSRQPFQTESPTEFNSVDPST